MKMFVVLALVAAAVAEPEANPDAQFYAGSYYNYGVPHRTYSAYPYTYGVSRPTYTYGVPRAHWVGKREAEADPALVYSSYVPSPLAATTHGYFTSPVVKYVASPALKTVATPVVKTVATAPVVKYVASPGVKNVATPVVASPFMPTVASHSITSYHSPTHYTAVSNGVFGPSYVAKNGVVQHVVKREAEAEADPALVYTNVMSPFPSTYSVASPLTTTFNHAVPAYHHLTVAAPLATNGAHAVAATTAGWTHSSNVGVCTNVMGHQVPC